MIQDTLPVNSYQGNGQTTKFDFNFYIEDESQLEVYLIKNDNTKTKLTYNVDYSINEFGNKNGSYIIFPSSSSSQYQKLADNERISLELSLKPIQQIEYNNSSLLNLESMEYSFDYLTRLIQILKRKLQLCIQVQEGTNETPADFIDKINQSQKDCSDTLAQVEAKLQAIVDLNSSTSGDTQITQAQLQNIASQLTKLRDDLDALYVTVSNTTPSGGTIATYVSQTYGTPGSTAYCRLWNNGFLEQFIKVNYNNKFEVMDSTCTLPMSFSDMSFYTYATANFTSGNSGGVQRIFINSKNEVSFEYSDLDTAVSPLIIRLSLYCCGMAEQ